MTRTPDANFFADTDGIYARFCSTKEEALKAMKELLIDDMIDPKDDIAKKITLENIEETRYYTHKKCGTYTFGDDNDCFECGEQCGTNGRRAFVIYFNA